MAWGVHLLTASGGVLAALALMEAAAGHASRVAIYMLAALAIDSVDGTLARRVGVAEVVPSVDGRRLDDIVDYLNYVIVPVIFMWSLGAFVHGAIAALPILASSYGFSRRDAKTGDDFFTGWPSYWNVVALYVWKLEMTPEIASFWVVFFSLGVLVPLHYVYPSRLRTQRLAANLGGAAWILAMTFIALFPVISERLRLVEISLVYPAYYVALSAWLGGWFTRRTSA